MKNDASSRHQTTIKQPSNKHAMIPPSPPPQIDVFIEQTVNKNDAVKEEIGISYRRYQLKKMSPKEPPGFHDELLSKITSKILSNAYHHDIQEITLKFTFKFHAKDPRDEICEITETGVLLGRVGPRTIPP